MMGRRSVGFAVCLVGSLIGCDGGAAAPSKPAVSSSSDDERAAQVDAEQAGAIQSKKLIGEYRSGEWFEDVTARSGVEFSCRNGREAERFYLIESFGGGVAMVDFDLDGDMDLFFTGGGTISGDSPVQIGGLRPALYRNSGGWQFKNVASAAGFTVAPDYSQGCTATDFNIDGFPDIFVCCYGQSRLYRNQGDGTFAAPLDETELPARGYGTAAAFGDFDRDGLPDLLLAQYFDWSPEVDVACYGAHGVRDLCGPTSYSTTSCRFFRNSGDGSFEDWSERVGMRGNVRGLGVAAMDFNSDGWLDFFVASDETPNHLYLGGPELPLEEGAVLAGVAVGEWGRPQGSMGVAVGDYDGDGLADLWITNFASEDDSLYRNLGDGLFMHATTAVGLSGVNRLLVGFGTSLTDFDGDGWLDIFVLNGHTLYHTPG